MPQKFKHLAASEPAPASELRTNLLLLANHLRTRNEREVSRIYSEAEFLDHFALAPGPKYHFLDYKNLASVFHPAAWQLWVSLSDNPYMGGLLLQNIGEYLTSEQKSINTFQVRKATAAVRETYFFTQAYKPLLTFQGELLSFGVVTCNRHNFALLLQRGAIVTSFAEKPRWNSILTFRHAR